MNQLRPDFAGPSLLDRGRAPLLERDDHSAPSVFRPENMLRESRRQKGLRSGAVPPVCVLDPDGDIVDHVRTQFGATRSPHWACYHTRLWERERDGVRYGIVGYAVGGAFSVLVAEQLFASGCRLLVNVASAGQIQRRRRAALLHPGGSRAQGRGDELSLSAAGGVRGCRPVADRPGASSLRAVRLSRSTPEARGRPMHRFARPPNPSRFAAPRASLRSRWKPPRSMHSPAPAGVRSSVWRTCPIGSAAWRETSRRATGTACADRSNW